MGQGTSRPVSVRGWDLPFVCLVADVISLEMEGCCLPRELLWSHLWPICLAFPSSRMAGLGCVVLCLSYSEFPNTELADWLFPKILNLKSLLYH